jgi:hypothetical protein
MKIFNKQKKEEITSLKLIREATLREQAAMDYDISDPYLAGKNSGRAEILRRWAITIK